MRRLWKMVKSWRVDRGSWLEGKYSKIRKEDSFWNCVLI